MTVTQKRIYDKAYYKKYGPKRKAWSKKRRDEIRMYLHRMKSRPCTDCGIQYNPWVMHFDHIDYKTKLFNIGNAASQSFPIDRIEKEISKCEVVCANCHSERTYKRLHEHKY